MFRISRLAALLLLTGCELADSVSSGRSSDAQPVRKAIPAAQPKAASKPSKETKVKQHLEFATFWPAFRQAVLQNDMDAIAGFVRFPVIGRGEMDDDPEEPIDRKSFAPIFREVLSQDGVIRSQDGSTRSGSLLKLIQAFPTYRDHQAMEGDARFDALRFERTNLGWKLIMIYTGPQD